MIIEENKLKDKYISVVSKQGETFGGSQSFFEEKKGFINNNRRKGGCGIVALGDLIRYLKNDKQFSSSEEYMNYFKKTAGNILWLPTPLGMNFLHQVLGLKLLLRKNALDYKAYWGFSRKKLYVRISRMLSNNIPVILCIPKLIGFKTKGKGLPFYRLSSDNTFKYAGCVSGHFVTVTGLIIYEGQKYMEISSWGQKLYLSFEEYMNFTKKTPMSLLGYNMCLSKNG